jgi:hypothetical protein
VTDGEGEQGSDVYSYVNMLLYVFNKSDLSWYIFVPSLFLSMEAKMEVLEGVEVVKSLVCCLCKCMRHVIWISSVNVVGRGLFS